MTCTATVLSTLVLLSVLASPVVAAESAPLQVVPPDQCMPGPEDYTFMWWAYGWRGQSPDGARVLAFQTGRFGMAIDVERVRLLTLGTIASPRPYEQAVADSNDVVLKLPPAELVIEIRTGGTLYRAVRARFPSRIIESGRFFQRCDIHGLVFQDDQGRELPATGRLEIAVWPDRTGFGVEVSPKRELPDAVLRLQVKTAGRDSPGPSEFKLVPGALTTVPWSADPDPAALVHDGSVRASSGAAPGRDLSLLPAHHPFYGWRPIDLPIVPADPVNAEPIERVQVELKNPNDRPQVFRLLFAKESGAWSITGMSPMLLDAKGGPTGIPVQISKNWHRKPDQRLLYEGPWFHGLTLMRLPPRSRTECRFTLAYGRWGGLPAASHAQLCLVGWGVDQLWDQAAIGSWGESICYDPDVNLNRAMIDDIRPLMVWAMDGNRRKWSWTNNVGGGDFLVYHDAQGKRQHLARMRTAYTAQCPNLTEVTYAGTTPDGAIAARITVSTPAVDDYNRAFHRLRYDVLRPTRFTRVAFYQLGADHYNDAPVRTLSWGNAAGLVESWEPGPDLRADAGYVRGFRCEGRAPWWFSFHHKLRHDDKGGAWANRGLIVRHWKARLGGRDVPLPHASFYRTRGEMGNVLVELAPPPAVKELLPGDFVEAEVHLLVLPIGAEDYYGPNEDLRGALGRDGDTWKMVHREAAGNDLAVEATRGSVLRSYPVAVAADASQRAEFSIRGGVGYAPITVTGLKRPDGWRLRQAIGDGWRTAGRSDFSQADYDAATRTWRLTWHVSLDHPAGKTSALRFLVDRAALVSGKGPF